ncbi:MAG: ABC transporter permease [Candidatus Woesearchaeota archaeon]
MLSEYLKMAMRSIFKRKKRTVLTMLGIFIGISAVVALVSLGQGLQKTINDQFEKVGADKIFVQAKEIGFTGKNAPGQLRERELDIVGDVNGVVQVAGYLARAVSAEFNDVQRTVLIMSVPKTAREAVLIDAVYTWEAGSGRLLSHKDKGKVVVGYNIAHKSVFGRDVVVGDKLRIQGELFDVVGTVKRIGDPGMDGGIILAEDDVRRLVNDSVSYTAVVAQAAAGVNPEEVGERIEKAIRRDRHQKEGKEDFTVTTATEFIASFNAVFNIIQVVFVGIAAISLLVGGIGIMNVMFTAVLERTREIGVMKAIGARNRDVLTLFLIESGILGVAGGIIGIIIGAGISKSVEFGANTAFGPGTITAVFPVWLIVGALLFSFVIGTVSGVLPARRASKLRPVEALRYE